MKQVLQLQVSHNGNKSCDHKQNVSDFYVQLQRNVIQRIFIEAFPKNLILLQSSKNRPRTAISNTSRSAD